jgi:hypothetical protein
MSEIIEAGLIYLGADMVYSLANAARIELNKRKLPRALKASQKLEHELNEWRKMKPIGPFSYLFKGSRIESAEEYKQAHNNLEYIEKELEELRAINSK